MRRLGFVIDEKYLVRRIEKRLCKNQQELYFHVPLSSYRNLPNHPLIQEADIIHLHWVSGMIDYPTFFKSIEKPIVWTMHDKHPLTGISHYLSKFNQVPDCVKDLDKKCVTIKEKSLCLTKNLHLVAISQMMEKLCQESIITKKFPVHLIHNGVDVEQFKQRTTKGLKQMLNIANENIVFLFSAGTLEDSNKGLKELIKALESISQQNISLVCIGSFKNIPTTTIDIKCLGYVRNCEELSALYSMANYFVLSSHEETFAQTPLEAMACGTPVIDFPCSGTSDLIRDVNGVICTDFTVQALKEAIELALTRDFDPNAIRQDVIARFSSDKIADKYLELYRSLIPKEEEREEALGLPTRIRQAKQIEF